MTIEEAIRRMECCRNFLANNYSDMGEPNVTAFNMAIKALSQEPLTEEDYIELHDRFGDYVEFVVRDMISGKGERWKGASKNDT